MAEAAKAEQSMLTWTAQQIVWMPLVAVKLAATSTVKLNTVELQTADGVLGPEATKTATDCAGPSKSRTNAARCTVPSGLQASCRSCRQV